MCVCVLWGKACLLVGEQVRMTMGTEGWICVIIIGFLSLTKKPSRLCGVLNSIAKEGQEQVC